MRIADLVKDFFSLKRRISELSAEELKILYGDLCRCDEFKNANLKLVDGPYVRFETSVQPAGSVMLPDSGSIEFTGDCYLTAICQTPAMYNPMTFEPVRKYYLRGLFNQRSEVSVTESTSVYSDWFNKWKTT